MQPAEEPRACRRRPRQLEKRPGARSGYRHNPNDRPAIAPCVVPPSSATKPSHVRRQRPTGETSPSSVQCLWSVTGLASPPLPAGGEQASRRCDDRKNREAMPALPAQNAENTVPHRSGRNRSVLWAFPPQEPGSSMKRVAPGRAALQGQKDARISGCCEPRGGPSAV